MSFLSSFSGRSSNPSSRRSPVAESSTPNRSRAGTMETKEGVDLGPKTSEILVKPGEGSAPKDKKTYTEEQKQKIEELHEYARGLLLPESDPYYPWELRFISDPGCMPRYMRAAKWKMPNAKERIKGTLEWRREYKPDLIKPDDVKIEAETGELIIHPPGIIRGIPSVLSGFDRDGRPVIAMRPGRENTDPSDRQILHLIYILERAIDLMPTGVETTVILVDYHSATTQTNPSIATSRKVLNILQNHYVERLGRAIVIKTPWWVNAFFSAITPFLDPVTKEKIRFNPKLSELIDPKQLEVDFGGEYNYEFNFEKYWNTLAPDGGRVDIEGKPCVPPAGSAAKAAFGNAHKAINSSNGLTKEPELAVGNSDRDVTQGQGLATNGSVKTGSGVAKSKDASVSSDASSEAGKSDVADRVKALSLDNRSEKRSASILSNGSVASDVEHPTAPGPPKSGVVFDHPPSGEETKLVQDMLQKEEDR